MTAATAVAETFDPAATMDSPSPPGGYLWAARTRLAGLPVTGYDRLGSGAGEMRWRLLRLIPVLNESGPTSPAAPSGAWPGRSC